MSKSNRYIEPDKALVAQLQDLKNMVETIATQPDIALRGGTYKKLADADVLTTKYNNLEIGYKVQLCTISVLRKIFVKVHDYKWDAIPEEERNSFMTAVFDVFLDKNQGSPEINQIAPDCLLITQQVIPLECRAPVCATVH